MANSLGTSRYALSDYTVTINVPAIGDLEAEQISIGGPGVNGYGSFVGEIKVTRSTELWTTEGDPTGSWVHNKNLNRTGTVEINIKQVAAAVYKLMMICSAYESVGSEDGLTITINPANGNAASSDFITCDDCYIQKIPDQDYTDTAKEQTWIFTCGKIEYSPTL